MALLPSLHPTRDWICQKTFSRYCPFNDNPCLGLILCSNPFWRLGGQTVRTFYHSYKISIKLSINVRDIYKFFLLNSFLSKNLHWTIIFVSIPRWGGGGGLVDRRWTARSQRKSIFKVVFDFVLPLTKVSVETIYMYFSGGNLIMHKDRLNVGTSISTCAQLKDYQHWIHSENPFSKIQKLIFFIFFYYLWISFLSRSSFERWRSLKRSRRTAQFEL